MDLKSFDLKHWWKALTGVGTLIALASIPGPFVPTLLTGLGLFFIGLGEWINHPFQTHIATRAYKVTSYNRLPKLSGNALDLLGAVLTAVGLVKLMIA
jgi:hypothetical protein